MVIQRARTSVEIIHDFEALRRTISEEARARGLTDDELADILDLDDDERRNLFS